ncbi:MAG: alpha-2-macroglobulin [Planctomycetes bacterium]|nr:alpha-2-macroglobulin [Planctomycetota bacterium]
MTPESPIIAELRGLLDKLCEESITPEQMQRLEALVLNHPEAEAHYIQFMSFYADLIHHVAGLPEPAVRERSKPRDSSLHVERKTSQEKPMKISRTQWGVAAALLFVLGGLGSLAAYQFVQWGDKSRDAKNAQLALDTSRGELTRLVAEQEASRVAAAKALEEATAQEQDLTRKYAAAVEAARKAIEAKEFMVRLTGPDRIQPGAPNKWQIDTLKHGAVARPKKLEVVVKDGKDVELFKQTHENPVGSATLELTTAFWEKVKPGSELFLEVVAFTDDDRKSALTERIPLARPVYVTHLATDKPLYKQGETIRFRSLTLDRSSLRPPANDMHLSFRLRDPSDAVVPLDEGNGRLLMNLAPVMGPDKKPVRGIGVGEYTLAPAAPGGEYKLDLFEINMRGQEVLLETRKFIVNAYVPDIFEKKLEFDGKSYGPGDIVQARIAVSRTAGGPMKDATANIVATIDGREIHKQDGAKFAIVNEGGAPKAVLNVRFQLPADLFTREAKKDTAISATLSVNIADGSDSEPIVRPIPLVTKNLLVEFFPEGGDTVEGLPGRVYFQVRTPIGKPADIKGFITDGTDKVIDVNTETDAENPGVNRGHGVFEFTPKPGTKYFLKLTSPLGITEPTKDGFPLPTAKADGIAMTTLDAVTDRGGAIRVKLQVSQGPKTLHVGAYARGRLIGHQKLDVEAGKPVEVKLQGDEAAGGVTRVTVFEELKVVAPGRTQLTPVAERLVYRKPGEQLMLNINPDKARYSPSGKVRLELSAFNEKEVPAAAILMVGVVNQSVITMADNKTDRLMPTHFLLSGEVKHPGELEHADFLLTDSPKAGKVLDLLLGTQGWRRFAEQNGAPKNPADQADVNRMLVAHGQRPSAPLELFRLEEQRLNAEFRPQMEHAILRRATATATWNEVQNPNGNAMGAKIAAANLAVRTNDKVHTDAEAELYRYESRPERLQSWGLPMFLVGLIGLAIGGLSMAVSNPGSRRPYIAGSIGMFGLSGLVIAAIVASQGTTASEFAAKQKEWEQERGDRAMMAKAAPQAAHDPKAVELMAAEAMPADFAGQAEGLGGGGRFPAAVPPRFDPLMRPRPNQKALPELGDAAKPGRNPIDAFVEGRLAAGEDKAAGRGEKFKVANALGKAEQLDGRRAMAGRIMPRPANEPMAGPRAPRDARDMEFNEEVMAQQAALPFVVREYAHERNPSLPEIRSDFTETVYWHPVLVLPDTGKATIEFQLSDDIARYQVLVAGHTTDGRIGAVTKTIEARKPFSLDPKLPLEISHTDLVDVPVRVTNDSDDRRSVGFSVAASGLKIEGKPSELFDLAPNAKSRRIVRMSADKLQGDASVLVTGTSNAAENDLIARTIKVVPDGFPGVGSFSDMIEGKTRGTINLPKDIVAGSLKVRLEVYPTSMADLVKGLEGLLREPCGCFEQTSTSNYPNTLILDYMNSTNQVNPQASARAKGLLANGYSKLTSFECMDTPQKQKQGFEWFGGADQQHEALTAYGLLQFKDMARVSQVDPQLIKRTQAFLMSRRDGNGGFKRNAQALDSFGGAPKHTTDAYIVWALVESDVDDNEKMDLSKEIAALKAQATKEDSVGGKDAYFVALVANVLLHRGDRETAHKLLDRLQEKHTKAGCVTGATTSITRSGGRDLEIETTAMSLLGWLRANDPKYGMTVKEATKWISQQRGGYGGFGSTQSTIMALKALILHAKKSAHPAESGEITVSVGGKQIAARKFTDKDVEVIGLDIEKPETLFKFGEKSEVEIVTDAKQAYPFALSYTYTTLTPVSAKDCAVKIETKLAKAEANEGDTVPLAVTLENLQKQGQGMTTAIVGIPAGMKVPTDMKQLIDLREKGQISFFEIRGRELVLYWREMAPSVKIALNIDLVCDVPGVYRGPASRGYLYYNADHKCWVEPLAIKIAPMADAAAK